jgi:hypothetical protein
MGVVSSRANGQMARIWAVRLELERCSGVGHHRFTGRQRFGAVYQIFGPDYQDAAAKADLT